MVTDKQGDHRRDEEAIRMLELAQAAIEARDVGQLAERLLPILADMMTSPAALMYLSDGHPAGPELFYHGFKELDAQYLREICAGQLTAVSGGGGASPAAEVGGTSLDLYELRADETRLGLIGLAAPAGAVLPELEPRVLKLIANAVIRTAERLKAEKQLANLNAYLTVSSMLAQQMGLQELLETALYCSMDVVSAEASSILLLGDEKKSFIFYQVEGPTKPTLMATTLEADKGIAGSVLQTQRAEIINDVQNDPRFYGNIDRQSGFHTRNMIAVPLVAEEQKIGVLEVLNKAGADAFSEDDLNLMRSIAEEIAFAIRNARMFEYVASTYCKQRQGQLSCKGCSRPLGTWTPCVKYRQAEQLP